MAEVLSQRMSPQLSPRSDFSSGGRSMFTSAPPRRSPRLATRSPRGFINPVDPFAQFSSVTALRAIDPRHGRMTLPAAREAIHRMNTLNARRDPLVREQISRLRTRGRPTTAAFFNALFDTCAQGASFLKRKSLPARLDEECQSPTPQQLQTGHRDEEARETPQEQNEPQIVAHARKQAQPGHVAFRSVQPRPVDTVPRNPKDFKAFIQTVSKHPGRSFSWKNPAFSFWSKSAEAALRSQALYDEEELTIKEEAITNWEAEAVPAWSPRRTDHLRPRRIAPTNILSQFSPDSPREDPNRRRCDPRSLNQGPRVEIAKGGKQSLEMGERNEECEPPLRDNLGPDTAGLMVSGSVLSNRDTPARLSSGPGISPLTSPKHVILEEPEVEHPRRSSKNPIPPMIKIEDLSTLGETSYNREAVLFRPDPRPLDPSQLSLRQFVGRGETSAQEQAKAQLRMDQTKYYYEKLLDWAETNERRIDPREIQVIHLSSNELEGTPRIDDDLMRRLPDERDSIQCGVTDAVYMALLSGRYKVALKTLSNSGLELSPISSLGRLVKEGYILTTIGFHPGIVGLIGIVVDPFYNLWLIMDLANGIDLHKLHYNHGIRLSAESRCTVMEWMLHSLAYLHSPPNGKQAVAHRDVKPENILIMQNSSAVLCDFGNAELVSEISGRAPGVTWLYAPPEVLFGQEVQGVVYGTAWDAWAAGCTILELLGLAHPFAHLLDGTPSGSSPDSVKRNFRKAVRDNKFRPRLPRTLQKPLLTLVAGLLHPNHQRRLVLPKAVRFLSENRSEILENIQAVLRASNAL